MLLIGGLFSGKRELTIYGQLWYGLLHFKHHTKKLLETVEIPFLAIRSDVSQPRCLTSEANEHTYSFWYMILSESNMEQLIQIIQKCNICLTIFIFYCAETFSFDRLIVKNELVEMQMFI